jgi:hypothetical protein
MFCKNCGHKINASQSFCGKCGAKLLQTAPNTTMSVQNRTAYSDVPQKSIVTMINRATGEEFQVKTGWDWDLFIYTDLFGSVWYMRKMFDMACLGTIMSVLEILLLPPYDISGGVTDVMRSFINGALNSPPFMLLTIIYLAFGVYCAWKGNEITIKRYLKRGYEIVDIAHP